VKLDICKVTFNDIKLTPRYAEKIRGYLGSKHSENNLLHNHENDKFIYRYPLVQYKVIKNIPMIVGIENGANIVASIGVNDDELVLDGNRYEMFQKNITKTNVSFGGTEDYIDYKFITPWIALNQNNSLIYKNSNKMEREELLKKILIGNIISMSKGLKYEIKEKINCWINITEKEVMLKNVKHIGFLGQFKVNFEVPDYFGIGKSVSRGFGTIKK